MTDTAISLRLALALVAVAATPATAQDALRRTRVALGPQLAPSYPGADSVSLRPLVDVARARGDEPFAFEAPDESFGPGLWRGRGWEVGPAVGFEGRRSRRDTGGALPPVGFTVELGGFAQVQLVRAVRLRGEVRHGIGGHRGTVGTIGADYVARDGDAWLFSLGPRLTLADGRYERAWFGVSPAASAAGGLPAFRAKGGVEAVGATAGLVRRITPRWGVYGYAKYDRLVADPARSPATRAFGSRNQLSGGVALTYTFARGVE